MPPSYACGDSIKNGLPTDKEILDPLKIILAPYAPFLCRWGQYQKWLTYWQGNSGPP